MKKRVIVLIFGIILLCPVIFANVVINEFVVSPKGDWNKDGKTYQGSDEWFELYNNGSSSINITGWNLSLIDNTNATQNLFGIIPPNSYFTILDPSGQQSIDGQVVLYDDFGVLVDSVTYGNWDDGNISDNAPTGSAKNESDECLARIPNGVDTDNDKDDFRKVKCSYNSTNDISTINFIINNSLEFGSVFQGHSYKLNLTIIIGENTHVNITFEIELGNSSDNLFENLYFDLNGDDLFTDNERLNKTLDYDVLDLEGEHFIELKTMLEIPVGYRAGSHSGNIIYTASEKM